MRLPIRRFGWLFTLVALVVIGTAWSESVDDDPQNNLHPASVRSATLMPPVFIDPSPADDTVSCARNIPPPSPLRAVTAANDTLLVIPTDSPATAAINACTGGTVVRTWTAIDAMTMDTARVSQRFTVEPDLTPVVYTPPGSTADTVACQLANYVAWRNGKLVQVSTALGGDCAGIGNITEDGPLASSGPCHTDTLTITITDNCGRQSNVVFTYTTIDTIAPQLNIPDSVSVIVTCAMPVPPPPVVVVTDNCTPNLVAQFTETSGQQADTASCGHYEYVILREWTVSDSCGNTTRAVQRIEVADDTPPTFTVPADVTIPCGVDPEDLTITGDVTDTSDDCGGPVEVFYTDMVMAGACDDERVIQRTWRASDVCGNPNGKVQIIRIADDLGPNFNVPADITVDCSEAEDLGITGQPSNVTDDCDPAPVVTYSDVVVPGACVNSYVIRRTWNALDRCGNFTEIEQIITVEDQQDPVFGQLPQSVVINCGQDTDVSQLFDNWVAQRAGADAEDNCTEEADLVWELYNQGSNNAPSLPALNCGGMGDTILMRTLDVIVVDECGNRDSATASFIVIDEEAPELSQCPAGLMVATDPGQCNAVVTLAPPLIEDACALGTLAENLSGSVLITSNAGPGQTGDTPANPIQFALPVTQPLPINAAGPGELTLLLSNADAEAAEEYFLVYGEDGSLLGRTGRSSVQCGSSDTTLAISIAQLNAWTTDGVVMLRLEPFIPSGLPGRFAINAICTPPGAVSVNLSFPVNQLSPLQFGYRIDGGAINNVQVGASPTLTLSQGSHMVTYVATDCAGNRDSCSFNVAVEDREPPVLSCPPNTTVNVAADSCVATRPLALPLGITDNCGAYNLYDQQQPATPEAAFITFSFDPNLNEYLAEDKTFLFQNVAANAYGNVTLEVEYLGDFSSNGAFFSVTGDDDSALGQTALNTANCTTAGQLSLSIPASVFNGWAADGEVRFRALPNDITVPPGVPGDGINPCDPGMVNANGDNDGSSYIRMRLRYDAINPSFYTSGATVTPVTTFPQPTLQQNLTFNRGATQVSYIAADQRGNRDTCTYTVTVQDATPPTVLCQPTTLFINPSGFQVEVVDAAQVDAGSEDNCGIAGLSLSPNTFTCSQIGQLVNVTLTATDLSGNSATCQTFVAIAAEGPQPTANSGLCGGDTLFLFANPPVTQGNVVYTYRWFNPANVLVSTQQNPVIPNISAASEGPYRVEIRGLTGCTAEGVVFVNIETLPVTPVLNAAASVCSEDNIVLSTALVPTGSNVRFHWYEGTPPNGILLATTTVPEYIIPGPHALGTRRFYLTVEANGCTSAPATAVNVMTVTRPIAAVTYTDTLACAGATISLGAQTVAGATYNWTGPNLTSSQQFPSVGPLTAVNQGYYRLVVSRGSCHSLPDSVLVGVKPRPARPALTNNGPVCEGSELRVFTTTTGVSTYQWQAPGMQVYTTSLPNYVVPYANASLAGGWRLSVTANGCESELSDPSNVVVNPKPVAGAQAMPSPVCSGSTLSLQGSSSVMNSSYDWTGPNMYTANVPSPVINNIQANQGGSYRLIVRSQSGCLDTALVNVNVAQSVAITGISDNVPACADEGIDVVITSSVFPANPGNYLYRWFFMGSQIAASPTLTIPNADAADAGLYTLEVITAQGCSSGQQSHLIDLNFTPAQPAQPVEVTGRTSFCEGETITLSTTNYNSPGITYYWSTPGNNIMTTTTNVLTITNVDLTDSGNYTVYAVRDGCASPTSSPRMIVVNAIPQLMVNTNSPVCEGDVISLSATFYPGATYNWSGPSGFSSSLSNPVIPNASPALHNGPFRVFATRNGCISDTISVAVTVKDRPDAPLVGSNSPICIGDPDAVLLLNIDNQSVINGATYTWYGPDAATPLGSPTGNAAFEFFNFQNFSAGGTFNFYARTDLDGCVSTLSAPTAVRLDVIPPNSAFAGLDTVVCSGQYQLRAQAPSVGTGMWSLISAGNPMGVTIANPDQANSILNGIALGGGPYVLRWTLSNGACANYSFDEVSINVTAAEQAIGGDDILVCEDEVVNLSATPPTGINSIGRWRQDLGQEVFGVVIQQPANPNTIITGLVPDNVFTFTWEVTSSCGVTTDLVRVIVSDPNPRAGADQIVCSSNPSALLGAQPATNGSSGAWSSATPGVTINSPNSASTTVSNLQPGLNVFVWTIDQGLCGNDSRDTVIVEYKLPPVAVQDVVSIPFGQPVILTPLSNDQTPNGSSIIAGSPPNRGSVAYPTDTTAVYTPPSNYVGEAAFTYQIVSEGCEPVDGSVLLLIGEEALCKAPSIITPNNDGVNDNFVVPCLLDTDRFPNSEVIIFNRWGDEVFRSTRPYQSNWNGIYDGVDLPADTYFFVIDFGDGSDPISGYVLIQR